MLLRTLALLAIPSAVSAGNSVVQPRVQTQPRLDRTNSFSVPAPASFSGTWKTARRCAPYTVILTQVGDKVTGTYSPGNGKLFDGVVTDDTLRFKWIEDGGEGVGELVMSFDGKNFTGTSSAIKPPGFIVAWNTIMPAVVPFAGKWQTFRDGKAFPLTMLQSGDHVMGLYEGNGKLEGTISGRVLRFNWQSDRGTGSGRFIMEEKNFSFSGSYNRGSNPDDVESTWSGKSMANPDGGGLGPCDPLGRVFGDPGNNGPEGRAMPMDKASEAEYAKKLAEYEAAQKLAPATFAGVWRTKLGEQVQFPELLLQQAGKQVTGRLFVNRPDLGIIREGIVDGNTLRFQVWRSRSPLPDAFANEYLGAGELVMNADGNSFTGTIVGAATVGTLIAR